MGKTIRFGEFQRKNLLLDHETPEIFGRAQCRRLDTLYLVYRVVCAVFFAGAWLVDVDLLYNSETPWYLGLVALTAWGYQALAMSAINECICAFYHLFKVKKSKGGFTYKEMPWLYKSSWFAYNTTIDTAPAIAVGYWVFVYQKSDGTPPFLSILTHAVTLGYVFINFWISGHPVRLLHFWQPLVFGAGYAVIVGAYTLAMGPVYSFLDWKNDPTLAFLVIFCGLLAIVATHVVWFILYKIKLAIYESSGCGPADHVGLTEQVDYRNNESPDITDITDLDYPHVTMVTGHADEGYNTSFYDVIGPITKPDSTQDMSTPTVHTELPGVPIIIISSQEMYHPYGDQQLVF